MAAKKTRLEMVRALLKENPYESQEELLAALKDAGFAVAQSTLSRDLHSLKVSKVFTDAGTYAYVLPAAPISKEASEKPVPHTFGFKSVDFSGNLAVVKTISGYAGSLSAELDHLASADVVGTVAGDDTIIVVLREGTQRSVVHNMLKAVIPHYGE